MNWRYRLPDLGGSRRSGAGVLLALGLALPVTAANDATAGAILAAMLLVIVGFVALLRAPLVSLQIATGLSLLCVVLALDVWPVPALAAIAYLAGRRAVDSRPAMVVFGVTALVALLLALVLGDGWRWLSMLVLETAAVVPWGVGRYLRLRHDLTDEGWRQAERLARESRSVAEQARLRERTRIAQDMHDSLGHRLSLITLQAGALEVSRGLDANAFAAAEQLRMTAAAATYQLHEIIGLLGEESGAETDPVVCSVEELIADARASGVPVTLHREGELSALDPMVDRAVYRVVQESLTNAIKHASGQPVTVRVTHDPEHVEVCVMNELPAAQPAAEDVSRINGGRGLLALHERVRLVGGVLRAGPRDGGFWVVADLPRVQAAIGGPPSDQVPGWPDPDGEVRSVRRKLLSDLRFTALVPIVLVVVLASTFAGFRVYTTYTLGLNPADYERIQVNQSRVSAQSYLPSSHLSKTLPVVPEPPAPVGAECEYFRTGKNPFDLSNDLYRLCWLGDRLVSKLLLHEKP